MNWITAAYKHKWQKLVDASYQSDNWYIAKKKTYGNYKYIKKYIISLVIISSLIVIPLRFLFDFADDQFDYIGLTAHGALILIPEAFILFILIKLPKFEDFIDVHTEIRIICIILIIIYILGLIASEFIEHFFEQSPSNQIKILIVYSVFKEFGNFCCLYIATGWVLKRFYSLIADENDLDRKQKRRQNARKAYRPTITLTNMQCLSSPPAKSPISEDKTLLLDEMDVFDKMTSFPMHEFGKYGNENDLSNIKNIQNAMGHIKLSDVLSHAHAFDMFMVHLSREFSMECLLSYLEMAQYREAVFSIMLDMKLIQNDDEIHKLSQVLPFKLPSSVPKSSIVYSRPFKNDESRYDFGQKIKRKAILLFNKYVRVGAEFEINIASRIRRDITHLMSNCQQFMQCDITEKELLVIFDPCCMEMVNLMQDSFRRFMRTTQFLKLSDLIFVKEESRSQPMSKQDLDPITPQCV